MLQFKADPGKLKFSPAEGAFDMVDPTLGDSAGRNIQISAQYAVEIDSIQLKDVRENGLKDGDAFLLRLPSGVGLGGEAGIKKLKEPLTIGPNGLNATLEFAPDEEG